MNKIIALVVAVVIVLFAASSMVFVVDQRHMAVLSSHGDTAPELLGPGLHVKLPPPLQTVTLVDNRIQSLDAPDEDRYVTSDKTDLLANPVIKYRVTDPLKLLAETRGDVQSLADRLALLSRSALGDAFGKVTLTDALAKQQAVADEARGAMEQSRGIAGRFGARRATDARRFPGGDGRLGLQADDRRTRAGRGRRTCEGHGRGRPDQGGCRQPATGDSRGRL